MNFFSLKINQKATLLNFFCLQGLTLPRVLAYRYSAPYKTGAGFDSLNSLAGSRYVSLQRFFYARNTTLPRIMAGRNGGALALAGFQTASLSTLLRLATMFDSVLARLHKLSLEAANMANSAQSQLVFLPYVFAVDPTESAFIQAMHYTEQSRLNHLKAALDESGVVWFDPRTKERSQPAATDSVVVQTMRNHRPCFVWRFVSGQNATYHTVTAASEREARLQLPAVRLVFAARIRVQEGNKPCLNSLSVW